MVEITNPQLLRKNQSGNANSEVLSSYFCQLLNKNLTDYIFPTCDFYFDDL